MTQPDARFKEMRERAETDEYRDRDKERLIAYAEAVNGLHRPKQIQVACPDRKPGCCVMHYAMSLWCDCGHLHPCPTAQLSEILRGER